MTTAQMAQLADFLDPGPETEPRVADHILWPHGPRTAAFELRALEAVVRLADDKLQVPVADQLCPCSLSLASPPGTVLQGPPSSMSPARSSSCPRVTAPSPAHRQRDFGELRAQVPGELPWEFRALLIAPTAHTAHTKMSLNCGCTTS